MCTRYYMELSPELRPYIEAAGNSSLLEKMTVNLGRPLVKGGEVRPADIAPVIATDRRGNPAAFPMVFGFPVRTGSLILNARTETADQKPMFKEAWSRRRCIVPASWYFEWQHITRQDGRKETGAKYMFQPEGSPAVWMCGLYRIENGIPYFVILTRDAADNIKSIHDRMPLIMPFSAVSSWIDPASDPGILLKQAITDVMFEKAV